MRNNLTRSLSGQSNPTPRSTRNSIDGDGGGQLRVKIVKGRGFAGEPCITTYYGETEVAQTSEWNVTVVATTAGPPSHKPHKRITLELREKFYEEAFFAHERARNEARRRRRLNAARRGKR